MATGSYTMNVNELKKTVEMTISGTFTPEKAQAFIAEYQLKVGGINAEDYILKMDCRDLDVVTQDMISDLESCMVLYKSSGFKLIEAGIKNSAIIKMQLKRLARNQGLTNFEVVEMY